MHGCWSQCEMQAFWWCHPLDSVVPILFWVVVFFSSLSSFPWLFQCFVSMNFLLSFLSLSDQPKLLFWNSETWNFLLDALIPKNNYFFLLKKYYSYIFLTQNKNKKKKKWSFWYKSGLMRENIPIIFILGYNLWKIKSSYPWYWVFMECLPLYLVFIMRCFI